MKRPTVTRDQVLFAVGLAGVIFEAVFRQADRPSLLAIFAGMMGLPLYLQHDEKKDNDDTPAPP